MKPVQHGGQSFLSEFHALCSVYWILIGFCCQLFCHGNSMNLFRQRIILHCLAFIFICYSNVIGV